MTAVEWLIEFIMKHGLVPKETLADNVIFHKAKEMEKQQIIETWHNGYNNQSPMIDENNCGQQYYNETFKTE